MNQNRKLKNKSMQLTSQMPSISCEEVLGEEIEWGCDSTIQPNAKHKLCGDVIGGKLKNMRQCDWPTKCYAWTKW